MAKVEWLLSFANAEFGDEPIRQIAAPAILNVLQSLEARERYESARRLRSTIGSVFRYAITTARAEIDPTYALRGALTQVQVTPRAAITDARKFGALLRAIDAFDGQPGTRIALQLLALLFPLPGESRLAEWAEFDLEQAVRSIPASRMKMRRPHRTPLPRQAVELLRALRSISKGNILLASVSGGFLRNLLGSYREHHPAIAMEVVEGSASEHLARITERHLDVAFVTGAPLVSHWDSVVLWEARVFAALREGHALADGDAIHWESLKDEQFIVSRDAPGPAIHDYIVRRKTTFGRSPVVERHGVGRETLMHLVALGLGISIASEAATSTQYPEVVFRPFAAAEDTLPYSAVWLPGNDNPALRRFLNLARSLASGRPAPDTPKWVS